MSLLIPGALGLLALLPIVVLFYLLKVRRLEQEISSTLLWDRLYRDLAAHEPWQRLRFQMLLLLQLILMALLVFAVARPFFVSTTRGAENVVILLDESASMQATDVAPSRFEQAKRLATDLVDRQGDGTTIELLGVRDRPAVLMNGTTRKSDVTGAIGQARPGSTSTNMRDAVILALSLLKNKPHPAIDIVSDGAFGDLGAFGGTAVPIRLLPVGARANNLGVVSLQVRADPQNRSQSEAFVRVRNYGGQPVRTVLSLLADGKPMTSRDVAIPAEGYSDAIFANLPVSAQVIEAKLQANDDLAIDNTAVAVLSQRDAARVLLVTPGNIFLERALRLLPLRLYTADPKTLGNLDTSGYDVIVLDGVMPREVPKGNLLLIDPPESPLLKVTGQLGPSQITSFERTDPVLQFVDLAPVQILKGRTYSLPGWMRPLASAGNTPVLFVGEDAGRKVAAVAFDLHDSTLPLQSSFPILVANLVGYVQPPTEQGVEQSAAGGTELIQPAQGAAIIQVRKPDQTLVALRPSGNRPLPFDQTDEVGLYTVTQADASKRQVASQLFAVNLLNDAESNIKPSGTLSLSAADVPPPSAASAIGVRRELWQILALFALGTLLFEWWWYHRRA